MADGEADGEVRVLLELAVRRTEARARGAGVVVLVGRIPGTSAPGRTGTLMGRVRPGGGSRDAAGELEAWAAQQRAS